ncbi:hypothetical protein G4D82_05750 [Flavobacterium sp. CYK-4]|uniref:hypothetical protein n=1 Tax=Flavobacterium lotistagni TaxID=2709660 RepID=UPI001409B721|nr:hypothetical protein [Flavobacterium lotistagni]NHM06716.1 hypothetical protein [Flavobacterium lotistagni]
MIAIPNKAKQFLVFAVKVLIVCAAFYFIYQQLSDNPQLDWQQFVVLFKKNYSISGVLFLLLLSFLNRFFEILKWQNLVSSFRSISLSQATAQVLGALTAGIFTPNGLGEYAGKALFYEKAKAKKIVFLNLVCNGIQMLLTVVFGILGLLYFNTQYPIITSQAVAIVTGLCLFLFLGSFFLKKFTVKGYSIEKLIRKINEIPKPVHQKNVVLGWCRYLVFSHQYYFLLLAFQVQLPYFLVMSAVTSVYFLASSLPSFQFLDFAVKGSVAVYFFGFLGVNQWIVIFITTLMWLLNVVIPVVIGSYYVLNFKLKPTP